MIKFALERFNINDFNVPETESCMNHLLVYKKAQMIMYTPSFRAYTKTRREIYFDEFLAKNRVIDKINDE